MDGLFVWVGSSEVDIAPRLGRWILRNTDRFSYPHPRGETGDEGWFEATGGFNLPVTAARFITGDIAEESDLDNTANVHPLGDDDLISLEGQCVCGVAYDSDVSIDYPEGGGTSANLQGATLGLAAFNVTATVAPGGLPESQSSSSLRDVVIELADPLLVSDVCADAHPDNVVRGDLSLLRQTGGDFSVATEECLDGAVGSDFNYPGSPGPGEVFWYVARPVSSDGSSTYDSGAASQVEGRDDEIAASGVGCP